MPDVTVYTGNFCGYCVQVTSLLERNGIPYTEVSVEDHPDLREKLLARSGRRTLPQVYVGETYIGGADELAAQYALAYSSRNPKRDGQWRRVVVRTTKPDLVARTKQGYYAPGSAPGGR